jgi:hypothetical protein
MAILCRPVANPGSIRIKRITVSLFLALALDPFCSHSLALSVSGMFRQTLVDGFQREAPDYWLNFGNPWEIVRPNVSYTVKFYGHVSTHEVEGRSVFRWNAGESVEAVAYDNPVPG